MKKLTDENIETQAKFTLKNNLSAVSKVNADDLNLLLDKFELVSYIKNTEIIKEGDIAEYFYFIYKGIIKIYFFINDKIVIDRFEEEGAFFGGNFTHLTNQPGTHVYESIDDVLLLRIKYKDLEKVCKESHDIERLYRISMEMFHRSYSTNLSKFKSLSSEERYYELIKHHTNIINRVPLKDIANYLNMTPETLSRIRAKYDKK
ncbi:MAG: Crp/Fnr family transcriptional regulator [Chitinophagales bacterium]|nr:Crp/Fnr family transcriptional regulator [Chitinophagales bacterium]